MRGVRPVGPVPGRRGGEMNGGAVRRDGQVLPPDTALVLAEAHATAEAVGRAVAS